MLLLTALLMFEASRLKQEVLPLNDPGSFQQRITTSDAAARILDLTPTLPDGFIAGIKDNSTLYEVVQGLERQRNNNRDLDQ